MVTNIVNNALNRYFTRLSLCGYVNYKEVESLLILTYILQLDYNSLEDDLKAIINKALNCLWNNTCLIPIIDCNNMCLYK